MDQRSAFKETIELAKARGVPDNAGPDNSCGLTHLLDMESCIRDDFSESKLGRWLGWAQGVIVAGGYATLDEMKEINKRWADKDTNGWRPITEDPPKDREVYLWGMTYGNGDVWYTHGYWDWDESNWVDSSGYLICDDGDIITDWKEIPDVVGPCGTILKGH